MKADETGQGLSGTGNDPERRIITMLVMYIRIQDKTLYPVFREDSFMINHNYYDALMYPDDDERKQPKNCPTKWYLNTVSKAMGTVTIGTFYSEEKAIAALDLIQKKLHDAINSFNLEIDVLVIPEG